MPFKKFFSDNRGSIAILLAGKDGFNKDNLELAGFEAIRGSLPEHSNVIYIENAGSFIHLANEWNVKAIFFDYDLAFFGYNGTIYAYGW